MKGYASIPKWSPDDFGKYIHCFNKIDGSNFRAEWNRKLSKKSNFTMGFGKYGTRREAIHKNSPFAEGIGIFEERLAEPLDLLFRTQKIFRGVDRITVYGEFYGDSSFAGIHKWDEPHDISVFDIFLFKKGFLPPMEFKHITDGIHINTPRFFLSQQFNQGLVDKINTGFFGLEEGMVCKGVEDGKVFMFKIKTDEWLKRVKTMYGEKQMLEY